MCKCTEKSFKVLKSFSQWKKQIKLVQKTKTTTENRKYPSHSRSSSLPSLTLHLQCWHLSGAGTQRSHRPDSLISRSKDTVFLSRVSKVKAFPEIWATGVIIHMDSGWLGVRCICKGLMLKFFLSLDSYRFKSKLPQFCSLTVLRDISLSVPEIRKEKKSKPKYTLRKQNRNLGLMCHHG